MEQTNMTMTYEFITPEIASDLLESNTNNRTLSKGVVLAYTNDILAGNWDESVGVAISIDENGVLRDGQHRLAAIVQAGVGIHSWVCRNVSPDGIYDNNRKRSNADQIAILRDDYEGVYKGSRYISVAKALMLGGEPLNRRMVTPKEIIDFTDAHKKDLDGFFLNMPQSTFAKVSTSTVFTALFMAYMAGVDIENILSFYDVLCTGMSTDPQCFPIIAYRNYLKDTVAQNSHGTYLELARCQYALKKYLTKSCTKRSIAPQALIYPFPWKK